MLQKWRLQPCRSPTISFGDRFRDILFVDLLIVRELSWILRERSERFKEYWWSQPCRPVLPRANPHIPSNQSAYLSWRYVALAALDSIGPLRVSNPFKIEMGVGQRPPATSQKVAGQPPSPF
jgi:hypothetical protein